MTTKAKVDCPSCDSVYEVHFHDADVNDIVSFCPFCGEDLDPTDYILIEGNVADEEHVEDEDVEKE